jgi:hypothetical protein
VHVDEPRHDRVGGGIDHRARVELVAMGLDRSNPAVVDHDVHVAEQFLALAVEDRPGVNHHRVWREWLPRQGDGNLLGLGVFRRDPTKPGRSEIDEVLGIALPSWRIGQVVCDACRSTQRRAVRSDADDPEPAFTDVGHSEAVWRPHGTVVQAVASRVVHDEGRGQL